MGTCNALARAIEEVVEAGEPLVRSAGNEEEELERCRVKDGDVEGPWVSVKTYSHCKSNARTVPSND